jgi:hypothetical protein
MASEVSKYSVFDPRIIQQKPKYAVEKGAASLTNVSVQAQTADSSSVQFNVQVPSENVFVDRAVQWQATAVAVISLTVANGPVPEGASLAGLIAPAAFPLHQSVSQMSATINDATVTVNTLDVLPQVLRLSDMADARRQRTCPTMLDRYAKYPDSRVVKNSPLLLWDQTKASDEVPNGGFNGFYFATDATGATPAVGTVASPVSVDGVDYVDGQPVAPSGGLADGSYDFYVAVSSVEKLLLPPFIFTDQDELSTGLFGVQNFQVQMNMAPSPARAFRVSDRVTFEDPQNGLVAGATVTLDSAAWSTTGAKAGMWATQPTLAVQFLTPSLDVPLPPKSIVPYMEFPRYISTPKTAVAPSTSLLSLSTDLLSNTITLPNIPDLLLIYVKPSAYADATFGDWSLPITKISMNFDNFSGLLSTMTQKQLYGMSVHNGVDMDWSEWSGYGQVPLSVDATPVLRSGGRVGLAGGPLVLRPGRDFALQSGQAPGLVGNFTLQFTVSVQNFTGLDLDGTSGAGKGPQPNIYVVPISSGFFETIKGSSRIIKGVLTEQDILGAPARAPEADLERPVGAGRGGMQYIKAAGPVHTNARDAMAASHRAMKSYM